MNHLVSITKAQGAYYPQWRADGATYFVTYRLAGSVPAFLFREIDTQRNEIISNAERLGRPLTKTEEDDLEELHFRQLDLRYYDRDSLYLKDPHVADLVADAFHHFDEVRYTLFACVVMPNHVHVVVQPENGWKLSEIIHSWKSYTATKANKLLRRQGEFWQKDYYNHLIRGETDLERCIRYTWENSDKAGLHHWKWRWKRNMQ